MILLTGTSDQFQFTTSSAQSTDWNCSWNEVNFAASTMVPGSTQGNQAAAATVVLIVPPAAGNQRQVKFLSIVNRDPTNPQTVIVQKVGASGTFNLTGAWVLQAGWMLEYVDGDGFKLLNAVGAIQYVGSAGSAGSTGSQGLSGPATFLEAESVDPDPVMIPGNPGAAGSTGASGPQGPATFLDAEAFEPDVFLVPGTPGASGGQGVPGPATFLVADVFEPDLFVVPGNPGQAGTPGAVGPAVYLDAEVNEPDLMLVPGLVGPPGAQGLQGVLGYGPPGADGDQGDDGMPIPGNPGPTGQTGATGVQGLATYLDAEAFEPDLFLVPGNPGAQGPQGVQGVLGYGPPGADGDQGDDGMPVPGAQGVPGFQGAPGVAVLLDADQGDDGFMVPGNPGANGTNGAPGATGPADLLWQMEVPDDQFYMPPGGDRGAILLAGGLSQEIVLASGSALTITPAQVQSADATLVVLNSNSGVAKVVTLPASTGSLARLLVVDGFGDAGTNNITFAGAAVFGVNLIYTNKGQLWLTDTKTLGWLAGI